MRILVPIDGSETSDAAVDEVLQGHFPDDSEVRIVSVVEPMYAPLADPVGGVNVNFFSDMESASLERAHATVEKAAAKLRQNEKGRRLSVTTVVLSGSPKREILEEAESYNADLIVVGSHGHGMLERFLLGSVSQAVALHAKCSVEIVRTAKSRASESK